jgi:hypothetical protein
MTTLRKILRPHGGFLTYGPAMAMDSSRSRHHRDQEEPDEGDGEIIARFPSTCTAAIEGNELVVRSGSADTPVTFEGDDVETLPHNQEETDRHSMDRRITRDLAPHTLAALNHFHQQFYGRRQRPRGG